MADSIDLPLGKRITKAELVRELTDSLRRDRSFTEEVTSAINRRVSASMGVPEARIGSRSILASPNQLGYNPFDKEHDTLSERLERRFHHHGKHHLRQIVRGYTGAIVGGMVMDFFGADKGLAGHIGHVAGAGLAGASFGGAPGALIGMLFAVVKQLEGLQEEYQEELSNVREQLAKRKEEIEAKFREARFEEAVVRGKMREEDFEETSKRVAKLRNFQARSEISVITSMFPD